MRIDRSNFSIVGIKPKFWSVQKCNDIIRNNTDLMSMFDSEKYKTYGDGVSPNPYPMTVWRQNTFIPDADLWKLAEEYNDKSYQFKLGNDTIQYINKITYRENLGWHKDNHEDLENYYRHKAPYRISIVINLNNKYDLGETEIFRHEPFKLNTGDAVVFSSHMWHRSKKVTNGTKFSFSWWITGVPVE